MVKTMGYTSQRSSWPFGHVARCGTKSREEGRWVGTAREPSLVEEKQDPQTTSPAVIRPPSLHDLDSQHKVGRRQPVPELKSPGTTCTCWRQVGAAAEPAVRS